MTVLMELEQHALERLIGAKAKGDHFMALIWLDQLDSIRQHLLPGIIKQGPARN